uniref:NADH-ubiquinone oxidoreductase chain 1 n=1 Tax=Rhyzodiastes puetzi TaxID=2983424 RepID=A0A977TJP4_9CARA|nr:NADH dehydrogenase subunit 1 [Rhyzodiastes puetzi]UXW64224.1 NADH dehydrogenase subunit 1 [Rhyzodiastes puetzi]
MLLLDLIMFIVSSLILVICVLVGVAFLTLFERKILGYIQFRKGPNKVGIMGIVQPFGDALKLFSKEKGYPLISNYIMYYWSPIFSLFIILLMWLIVPYCFIMISFDLSVMFMLCVMSLGVYAMMIAGWSSNSKYSLLGSIRAIAQTISYEVSLALVMISFIFLNGGYSLVEFMKNQEFFWFFLLGGPLMLIWCVIMLAETNRAPFDFAEGESELVSGFNVEYSSGGFALLFLAEYTSILFMSLLFVVMFLGSNLNSFGFYFKLVVLIFGFIWVRGAFPRFRYDKLMYLAWKIFLPMTLNMLVFYIGLKFICLMLI